jgi:hypothetical protein
VVAEDAVVPEAPAVEHPVEVVVAPAVEEQLQLVRLLVAELRAVEPLAGEHQLVVVDVVAPAVEEQLQVVLRAVERRVVELDVAVAAVEQRRRHRKNWVMASTRSRAAIAVLQSSLKITLSSLMHLRLGLMAPWLKLRNCSPTSRSNMWWLFTTTTIMKGRFGPLSWRVG